MQIRRALDISICGKGIKTMKKNRKIWIALALAFCMTTILAVPAFADDATVTFYLDSEGTQVYQTETYTDGGRITQPEDPVSEDGSAFCGWYEDPEYTTEVNFVERKNGDQAFYARWNNRYVFEAEYTQLIGREVDGATDGNGNLYGSGYSNEPKGLQLISNNADRPAEASNDYYLHDLYRNGLYIEFIIESDRAVEDAILTLRLAGEYYDCEINDENFYVSVYPEGTEDPYDEDVVTFFEFDPISFTLERSGDYAALGTFEDYQISTEMPLVEGKNIVRLEIANSEHHGAGGTVNASAPMIDCIIIDTDAVLTWEPIESNIE